MIYTAGHGCGKLLLQTWIELFRVDNLKNYKVLGVFIWKWMDTILFIQLRSLNFVANPCTTKSKHKLLYVKNIWRTFHPDSTGSKQNLKW